MSVVAFLLSDAEMALVDGAVAETAVAGASRSDWLRSAITATLTDGVLDRVAHAVVEVPGAPSIEDLSRDFEPPELDGVEPGLPPRVQISRTRTVAVRLSDELLLAVDQARGTVPRKAWLRAAILTAAGAQLETADGSQGVLVP